MNIAGEQDVEAAAERLLRAYEAECGPFVAPPIPVEAILKSYLGLTIVAKQLPAGVLGALNVDTRQVFVATALSASSGRYYFTLAHEVGHWELHAFQRTAGATSYCYDRSHLTKEREANLFAACFLMPRGVMHREWQRHHSAPARDAKRSMAQSFGVSGAAMSMRLAALEILPGLWGPKDDWPFRRRM
jgi:Zn-dependent peptidase ImmA (M78 family)